MFGSCEPAFVVGRRIAPPFQEVIFFCHHGHPSRRFLRVSHFARSDSPSFSLRGGLGLFWAPKHADVITRLRCYAFRAKFFVHHLIAVEICFLLPLEMPFVLPFPAPPWKNLFSFSSSFPTNSCLWYSRPLLHESQPIPHIKMKEYSLFP